jgi:1,5-anhydro-D-fructose reductase (1,5-anhydro-D-mannitol-forming)
MTFRWAIIGAGEFARRGMAPGLKLAAGSELAAVYCRTLAKARAFAAQHEVEKAYDSLEALLEDPAIDAVYIATPNSLHAEHTLAAARAGKHVLCEKPMATSVRDAEAMIEGCDRHGITLGVVFQNRYHHAHREARRHVESGALGEVDHVSAQMCRGFFRGRHWSGWRVDPAMTGAGAIVAQAVHPIDLLRYLLGAEVVEVQAMTDEAPPRMPIEEMSYTLLKFTNGAHATVVAGTLLPRFDNDVVLYGTKAKIACRATVGLPRAGTQAEMTIESDTLTTRVEFPGDNSQPAKMARMVEDFIGSIREKTQPELSGRNGLQMVKIALAIQEASRQRRAVRVDP